ncbi:tetratricopeptide repeat protein [Zoogloea sp.]|uniref:tetratricopeptide repeat protein n=1 Tax=Zoogloea sp. TaxID=49181 RepID=UPI00261C9869|nr:tetratricopeptide repeat protein [Zoogloea sp.]MDD3353902.1 tetratricopeptide repeat protein [Zoogloea sp.]
MSKRVLAASLLLASLTCSPLASAATLQEIQALVRQGQLPQALEKTDQMLSSRPQDAQLRFLRGVVLSELNRPAEAITIFQKLTEDFPELPEPYNNLAVLYAQQRQYDKARTALERAIRTHPSYATAHENLGDIYARLASQAYDKALALDSSNQVAQSKLALIREMISVGGKTARPAGSAGGATPGSAAKPVEAPVLPAPPAQIVAKTTPPTGTVPHAPPPAVSTSVTKPITVPQTPSVSPTPPLAEPKTAAKRPEPKEGAPSQNIAVIRSVTQWAAVWSRKDVKAYLGHYARDFQPPKGMNRKAWEEERSQRLTKPGAIQVELENIQVRDVSAGKATVKLRQHYRSANLNTSSNKTLILVNQDGQWLIQQEKVGG